MIEAAEEIAPRALAAPWEALTAAEQEQAIAAARAEGRRAARWLLAEPTDGSPVGLSLRGSRWARAHGGLDALPDDVFHLYAGAATVPCEADYVERIIEPRWPDHAAAWWEREPAQRQNDPRVCAFCDGYERERCRLLELPLPPTSVADLQLHRQEAKEQEREAARAWLESMEEVDESADQAETQQSIARWEYQRLTLCTDLAGMLLNFALHRAGDLSFCRESAKGVKAPNAVSRRRGVRRPATGPTPSR